MIKQIVTFFACISLGMVSMAAFADELKILYPQPYTLFQRDTAKKGIVKIRGTYNSDKQPVHIEARLNGSKWQVVDAHPANNAFNGTMAASVGQGLLEVRAVGCSDLKASVECVGVGDLFLITGQSNADGRGKEWVKLESSNPYIGVKYLHNTWSKGEDPSSSDTSDPSESASPWPIALNRLIPDQKVPIGFIAAAMGSTVVKQWRKTEGATGDNCWGAGGMFARTVDMVKAATDGSMKVKAIIYHQGENDLTHWNNLSVLGDYQEYKTNLMAAISDLWDEYHVPILVGQITNLGDDRQRNDNIRRAQQELWNEHPHSLPGAVTYDIFPTDGVHYREPANMKTYSDRWTAAILCGVYGQRKMAGPKLVGIHRGKENQLILTFNQPMVLKSWNGKTGIKPDGFRFIESDQIPADVQILSTKIEGKKVILELSRGLPTDAKVDLGSGSDGQDGLVLRSAVTGLPAAMMFMTGIK
jgi:hypothetical protein